eukprot:1710441-Rhodomonas_salina.1
MASELYADKGASSGCFGAIKTPSPADFPEASEPRGSVPLALCAVRWPEVTRALRGQELWVPEAKARAARPSQPELAQNQHLLAPIHNAGLQGKGGLRAGPGRTQSRRGRTRFPARCCRQRARAGANVILDFVKFSSVSSTAASDVHQLTQQHTLGSLPAGARRPRYRRVPSTPTTAACGRS